MITDSLCRIVYVNMISNLNIFQICKNQNEDFGESANFLFTDLSEIYSNLKNNIDKNCSAKTVSIRYILVLE